MGASPGHGAPVGCGTGRVNRPPVTSRWPPGSLEKLEHLVAISNGRAEASEPVGEAWMFSSEQI